MLLRIPGCQVQGYSGHLVVRSEDTVDTWLSGLRIQWTPGCQVQGYNGHLVVRSHCQALFLGHVPKSPCYDVMEGLLA